MSPVSIDLDELAKWLKFQLELDEWAASMAGAGWPPAAIRGGLAGDVLPVVPAAQAKHIDRQQPRHTLGVVAAHQRLVEECERVLHPAPMGLSWQRRAGLGPTVRELALAEMTLRLLASGYADRDGFRPEWLV